VNGKSAPSSSEMATTPNARNSQPPTEEAEVPDSKSDRSDVSSVDLDESERGEAPGEMVHLGRSASAGVSVSGAAKAVAKETSVRYVLIAYFAHSCTSNLVLTASLRCQSQVRRGCGCFGWLLGGPHSQSHGGARTAALAARHADPRDLLRRGAW
jgi:hypothetical protein